MMHAHDFEPGLAASPHVAVSREVEQADTAMVEAASNGHADAFSPRTLLSLQRLAGNVSVGSLLSEEAEEQSPVRDVVNSGGGTPLDSSTRHDMEARLGHDFTDVRVHTDATADASAHSINAQAYTVGNNVVFQTGKYAPDTPAGMHTLAHELTHVVQQRSGPVAGSPAPGGIRLSDPSDPFEQAAERSAGAAMSPTATASGSGEASVQRAGEEEEKEEETAQTMVAQRAGEEEQEEETA